MLACVAALSASADVTTFYVQAAPMCRYDGKADQLVMIPEGFTMRQASEPKQRGDAFVEKSLVSDRVEIFEEWVRNPAKFDDVLNLVPCSHALCGSWRWYWGRALRISPAAGLTVTKVRIKLQNKDNFPIAVVEPGTDSEGNGILQTKASMSYNAADSTFTLDCNYNQPFYIQNMGENSECKTGTMRPIFFEITTSGTATQVATPQYIRNHPMLGADEKIELTCATPDAQIYYTVDSDRNWNSGQSAVNKPSPESTLYTGPFTVEKDAIIRAIAVKDGMTPSFVMYQDIYNMPAYEQVADFDFTDHTAIKDEDGKQIADFLTYPVVNTAVSTSTVEKVSIVTTPAVEKDAYVTGTITNEENGQGCDITLSNTFGGVVELRPLANSQLFIGVPDDKYISAVYITGGYTEKLVNNESTPGTFAKGYVNGCDKVWQYDGKDVYEVVVDVTGSSQYLDRFMVFYSDVNPHSGVADVVTDANAPVEYFNLQGMRVDNPVKGNIYIKCQGAKATKVVL